MSMFEDGEGGNVNAEEASDGDRDDDLGEEDGLGGEDEVPGDAEDEEEEFGEVKETAMHRLPSKTGLSRGETLRVLALREVSTFWQNACKL